MLLLLAILACAPQIPPPPGPQPLQEDRDPTISLFHAPATWRFPAPSAPAPSRPPSEVEGVARTVQGRMLFRLPYALPDISFPPVGMEVLVGGEVIPYLRTYQGSYWEFEDAQTIRLRGLPEQEVRVKVLNPAMVAGDTRRDFSRAGLSPEEYVHYRFEGGEVSRRGLLMPEGSEGTWAISGGGQMVGTLETVTGEKGELHIAVRRGERWGELGRLGIQAGVIGQISVTVPDDAEALRLSAHGAQLLVGAPELRRPAPTVRRVVVIGVDTLRPDHLGVEGYSRSTSPELDALARESTRFVTAWAPAPRTRPSFRTATTGRFPLDAVGARTLGEAFSEAGFATGAFVANIHLHPRFGFDRGFDLWWRDPPARADLQVDRALAWLDAYQYRDTFLFLHLMDPHLPYAPPEGMGAFLEPGEADLIPPAFTVWDVQKWQRQARLSPEMKRQMEARYDAEIAWTSRQVGRFLEGLDALGGSNAVIFHSDHGEEFWEHGGFEHNHALYEELVRVALWVRTPDRIGGEVSGPASLADIAPTALELVGIAPDKDLDGRSLVPTLRGEALPDRPLPLGFFQRGKDAVGVVYQGHKYILYTWDGAEALYDLKADPKETRNLAVERDTAPWLRALAEAHHAEAGPGLRLDVDLIPGSSPLVWHLPAPARDAWVIEPEVARPYRANVAWGQLPERTAESAGTVELKDDILTFFPGERPQGRIAVRLREPWPARGERKLAHTPGVLSRSGARLPWNLAGGWSEGRERVTLLMGPVVLPQRDEAQRMGETVGQTQDEAKLLRELGYLQE